jgi:hypothetical protein
MGRARKERAADAVEGDLRARRAIAVRARVTGQKAPTSELIALALSHATFHAMSDPGTGT